MKAFLRRAAFPLLVFGPLLLGAAGCATSGLVNAWRDPTGPGAPLDNVLVIAVKPDEGARRLMEDAFVSALAREGLRATPSYRLFGTAVPDTQQVIDAVARDGYDGVIVSSRLSTDTVETYVPGYTTTEPRTRYSTWRQRYHTYYVDVEHPGYVAVDRIARHRVEVWSVTDGGRLLWTAEGQSIDPTSNSQINKEITKAVIPELVESGILARR